MDVKAKARTCAKGPKSRRANTNVFHLRLVTEGEDVKVRVCKKTFIETLGVTLSRVDRVLKKKVSTRRLSLMDDRGKHGTRPRKIQAEAVERVKRHISKFPAEESHYSRESNGGTKYISGELSLSKMYHLYLEEAEQEQFVPVKESFYRHVFNTQFDLKFHQPRSDTCKTCEELKLNIQTADDEDEKEQLKRARDLHHRRADAARKAMESDAKTAGDNERVYCLSFDLQQTLDTPKLPVGEAYYSRQLSTFNLAVVNNTTLHANMYIWNEADGRRGSDEIGSCLLKYIDDLRQEVDHLILYLDGCGGRNKNHQLQMLWMRLVASGRFKQIDHKFLVVGHTYLPCDRCFAHIEKKKRKTDYVFTTDEWARVIRESRPKKPFKVVRMTSADFVDIDASLKEHVTIRQVTTEKQPLNFQKVMIFSHKEDRKFQIEVKYSHGPLQPPSYVSYEIQRMRKGRPSTSDGLASAELLSKYEDAGCYISKAKYDDLQKLLRFIPPHHHAEYKELSFDTSAD